MHILNTKRQQKVIKENINKQEKILSSKNLADQFETLAKELFNNNNVTDHPRTYKNI